MKRMVKASEASRRLITIPGVGHLTESAVTAGLTIPSASVHLATNRRFRCHIRRWSRTIAQGGLPLCAEGSNIRFPADPTIRWLGRNGPLGGNLSHSCPGTQCRICRAKPSFTSSSNTECQRRREDASAAGVKMHHGGPPTGAQLSSSIDEPASPSRPGDRWPRRAA
jgi:hypothetical protein